MNIAFRPNSSLRLLPRTHKCTSSTTRQITAAAAAAVENPTRPGTPENDHENYIISALRDCSSNSWVPRGQQLHGHVVKLGLDGSIFIRNSLISFYSKSVCIRAAKRLFDESEVLDAVSCNIMVGGYVKSGYLNEARELFDKMPVRNCISFTTMIMGLKKGGLFREAIRVFERMRFVGVCPNEVTMGTVISAFLQVQGWKVDEGRGLHGTVMKLGLLRQVLVSTNLLHMYCLGSRVRDASVLFDEMDERSAVSWNVMLNGYVKAGNVDHAWELFAKIEDKDVVSWGTIIDGYLKAERLSDAVCLYHKMVRSGLYPNDVMIVDMISACGKAGVFKEGMQFHTISTKNGFHSYDLIQTTLIHFYAASESVSCACLQFRLGNKRHLPNWNALISGLVRNERLDEARRLFDEMPERDIFSWSSMISGYSQKEKPKLALDLFHEMVKCGFRPNEITMVSVLSAIAALGNLHEGKTAHEFIRENTIPCTDNLTAAIIDMYAKCGSISTALEVFDKIKYQTFDVSPWNAMICNSGMHGHAEVALMTFSDLKSRKITPNAITFIGVLTACCHAGLVEEGKRHFASMESVYALNPSVKHYGCMVDLLGRAGRVKEAEELIRGMPMEADVVIWGTLLAASRMHGDTDVGERAAEALARLEPSHGPSRVLLSSLYADAGRWSDAFSVRKAMVDQNLIRSPAYSGIV